MTTGRINQVSIVRTRGRAGRRDVTRSVPLGTRGGRGSNAKARLLHRANAGRTTLAGGTTRGVVLQRGTHRGASPFLAEKKHSDVFVGSV